MASNHLGSGIRVVLLALGRRVLDRKPGGFAARQEPCLLSVSHRARKEKAALLKKLLFLGSFLSQSVFFHNFQSLEIIGGTYVSIYGGVLSLFVNFSCVSLSKNSARESQRVPAQYVNLSRDTKSFFLRDERPNGRSRSPRLCCMKTHTAFTCAFMVTSRSPSG